MALERSSVEAMPSTLWPRAGDWPALGRLDGEVDAALIGVPAWRTSLSPTGAHATPAAVRDALRRYSPTLMGAPPIDLGEALRDRRRRRRRRARRTGGRGRVRARVARGSRARAGLVVALGGDNCATYAVAQGAGARASSRSTPTSTCATASPTAPPCGGSSRTASTRAAIVQIGIADFANSVAYAQRAADYGITVITLDDVRRRGRGRRHGRGARGRGRGRRRHPPRHRCRRLRPLGRARAAPRRVPGGLAAWELRALVRAAASDARARVSADIVEVDATADAPDGRTVRLAALCVLELLAGMGGTRMIRLALVRHAKSDWGDPTPRRSRPAAERPRHARCARAWRGDSPRPGFRPM